MIFFGCLGERPLAFFQNIHAGPSSTQTHFAFGLFHPPKRTALPLLFYFKELLFLNHSSPAKKRKDERLEHELPWDFKKCPTLAEDAKRNGRRRRGRSPGRPVMAFMRVTKGFLSREFTSRHAFGARHSLEMIDIPAGTPKRRVSGNHTWKIQPV